MTKNGKKYWLFVCVNELILTRQFPLKTRPKCQSYCVPEFGLWNWSISANVKRDWSEIHHVDAEEYIKAIVSWSIEECDSSGGEALLHLRTSRFFFFTFNCIYGLVFFFNFLWKILTKNPFQFAFKSYFWKNMYERQLLL